MTDGVAPRDGERERMDCHDAANGAARPRDQHRGRIEVHVAGRTRRRTVLHEDAAGAHHGHTTSGARPEPQRHAPGLHVEDADVIRELRWEPHIGRRHVEYERIRHITVDTAMHAGRLRVQFHDVNGPASDERFE